MDMRLIKSKFFDIDVASRPSVIARTVFNFGFLANRFSTEIQFPARDHRSRFSRAEIKDWIHISERMLGKAGVVDLDSIHQRVATSLKFCLSVNVSSALVGALTPAEIECNVKALPNKTFSQSTLEILMEALGNEEQN